MRAFVVVEPDPVADSTGRMSQAFEALAMDALLFQGPDHALHHAVLLGTMGRDELLAQSVTFDQVHAEMAAISTAARLGLSLAGSSLYCTTFPCHNCSKHIVATGVSEVFYLEP